MENSKGFQTLWQIKTVRVVEGVEQNKGFIQQENT